jgi:hypothetical protein
MFEEESAVVQDVDALFECYARGKNHICPRSRSGVLTGV